MKNSIQVECACGSPLTKRNTTGLCRMCYKRSYEKSYCIERYKNDEQFREKQIKRVLKYQKENLTKILKYKSKYIKEREATDINFKLSNSLRSRLGHAIRNNQKVGSAVKDLGCTVKELKHYLEAQFISDMSWDNYGLKGWHIDHIKPLSSFDLQDPNEFKKACHYSNLQPLWAKDNLSKGNTI